MWVSAAAASATSAALHSVTDHVKMVGMEFSRIESQEGKQSMNRGRLGRIQRAKPRMGIMMPISKVNTTHKPAAAPGNSPIAGISSLGRGNTEGRRED